MVKLGKNTEFDKLSWQRQKAVIQLFQGKTLKEISQDVGVHLNTVENWKKDEKFQKARTEYSVYAFSHLLPQVVSNLNRILNEGNDKNVLKAIQIILSNSDLLNSQSSQKLLKARIRKETAEAAKAEAEAEVAKAQVEQLHTVADKTREKMDKLSIEDLRNLAKMAGEDSD